MTLTIKGETELYRRLDTVSDVLKNKFWVNVKDDLKDNLDANIAKHNKSGKLERNAYAKVIDNGAEVGVKNEGMLVTWRGTRINYAMFLEHGTRDHDIAPKNKKALRWVGGNGKFFFSKGHRVSGIKATHFLENAAKETFKNLDRLFSQSLKDV